MALRRFSLANCVCVMLNDVKVSVYRRLARHGGLSSGRGGGQDSGAEFGSAGFVPGQRQHDGPICGICVLRESGVAENIRALWFYNQSVDLRQAIKTFARIELPAAKVRNRMKRPRMLELFVWRTRIFWSPADGLREQAPE
jgi:hypothetical protein